jgi:hypothetical protein
MINSKGNKKTLVNHGNNLPQDHTGSLVYYHCFNVITFDPGNAVRKNVLNSQECYVNRLRISTNVTNFHKMMPKLFSTLL